MRGGENINYTCHYDEHTVTGQVILEDINVQHGAFDPLAKIWSSVRKRIREEFDVDVTGIFVYVQGDVAICRFLANFGLYDHTATKEQLKEYAQRFAVNFERIAAKFYEAVEAFRMSGYLAKYNSIADDGDFDEMNVLMNRFLREYGFKKNGDNRKPPKKKKS